MTAPAVRNVVIFGLGKMASLAWYVLTHDSPCRVVAFTVDEAYRDRDSLHDLPVVPFERIVEHFPPGRCGMHLPIGWKGMNALRAEKLAVAQALGYPIVNYLSSKASVWHDLRLGVNTAIHQSASVGPFAEIGDDCLVYGGGLIAHHASIADHCYIAGRATVLAGVTIGDGCVLGASCTIQPGVKVAPRCFIGAGALVTRDTEENGVYTGMPARRRKLTALRMPSVR